MKTTNNVRPLRGPVHLDPQRSRAPQRIAVQAHCAAVANFGHGARVVSFGPRVACEAEAKRVLVAAAKAGVKLGKTSIIEIQPIGQQPIPVANFMIYDRQVVADGPHLL